MKTRGNCVYSRTAALFRTSGISNIGSGKKISPIFVYYALACDKRFPPCSSRKKNCREVTSACNASVLPQHVGILNIQHEVYQYYPGTWPSISCTSVPHSHR